MVNKYFCFIVYFLFFLENFTAAAECVRTIIPAAVRIYYNKRNLHLTRKCCQLQFANLIEMHP